MGSFEVGDPFYIFTHYLSKICFKLLYIYTYVVSSVDILNLEFLHNVVAK